jgi:hypothetical protein
MGIAGTVREIKRKRFPTQEGNGQNTGAGVHQSLFKES